LKAFKGNALLTQGQHDGLQTKGRASSAEELLRSLGYSGEDKGAFGGQRSGGHPGAGADREIGQPDFGPAQSMQAPRGLGAPHAFPTFKMSG
jgi:hypothetical protein